MTASVGNTPPRGVDSLVQSGSAKISGGGGFRRHAVHQDEANAQSEDVNQNASPTELDRSQSRVDHAGKVSKRESGKEDAVSDDGSFEDTFKSMGEDAPKDASSNVTAAPSYPAGLLLAQTTTGNITVGNSDPTQSTPQTSGVAARSTPLLKQKNILALMDTKERIFTNQDTDKTDDANAGQALPEHSDGVADAIPLTVDRQEAHWNFNNDAISSAASKVSALQTGAQLAPRVLKQALSDNASPVQTSEAKTSNGAPQDLTPQAVVMPDSGQSANGALSGGGDGAPGDSQLQNGADLPTESGSKSARTDVSSSIDQLLGAATGSQSQQGVTTQVRDGVINSLATNASDPSANSVATPNRPATASVLRTLDLTLSPPDLGSVKLRLSLKSNSLSIEAEASKASTAKLLSDDRTNLERGLRDAGYDVSSMKITDTSASSSQNTGGWQQGSAQTRDGEQSRPAFGSRQDGEMQRRDASTSNQSQRRQRQEDPQQTVEPANSRPSSAVYI